MTESGARERKSRWQVPTLLCGAVVTLLAFGLVMLASASRVRAVDRHGDAFFYVRRQAMWMGLGLLAAFVMARINYRLYKKWFGYIFALAVLGLILVFLPGIGVRRGGSYRWITLFGLQFQPSEFAKLAVVIALAAWYANRPRRVANFLEGVAAPVAMIGVIAVLLLLEPDYGTVALVSATGVGIMFVSGVKLIYLGMFSLVGIGLFLLAILQNPHRLGRVFALVFPERYPDAAYQLLQSKDAFSLGGLTGIGLGESIQKHYYLPEAHTDFIFAIIGEELGLPATGAIILLFFAIFLCSLRIAARAPDRFGSLLSIGLAMILVMQAALNIAVVTGCLPTKGITLPFISYGGSSLLISMALIGLLINIARHSAPVDDRGSDGLIHTRELRDPDTS